MTLLNLFLLRQKISDAHCALVAVISAAAAAKHMGKTTKGRGAGYRLTRTVRTSGVKKETSEGERGGFVNKRFSRCSFVLDASLFKGRPLSLTLRRRRNKKGDCRKKKGGEGMKEENTTPTTPRAPQQLPTQKHHLQSLWTGTDVAYSTSGSSAVDAEHK